jgi:hypothetical protein
MGEDFLDSVMTFSRYSASNFGLGRLDNLLINLDLDWCRLSRPPGLSRPVVIIYSLYCSLK